MMKITLTLFALFILPIGAFAGMTITKHQIPLGESVVRVNVYENNGAAVTMFAPHYNERTGTLLASESVARKGGRLVEIVSTDDRGNAVRNLKFSQLGRDYVVDPNRIFTSNGRNCAVPSEVRETVTQFAESLLRLIFAPDGRSLRAGEKFLVAIHNNTDVSSKPAASQSGDLTAVAFVRAQSMKNLHHGAFEAQADGVFLSNTETDEDNFIFLSSPTHIGHFATRGFNVVVQKPKLRLQSTQCSVDDGSMSIYTAFNDLPYVCLEADGVNGAMRQRQMLDAVHSLLAAEPVVLAQPIVAPTR
jgi:hypothetical protein